MDSAKVRDFIELAGQSLPEKLDLRDPATRKLGAGLVLSETLEYVIKGLKLKVKVDGQEVSDPQALEFEVAAEPDSEEMLDGLADVAYTMYWNALSFGMPIEEAYEAVCDNNLEKFVKLSGEDWQVGEIDSSKWDLGLSISWPDSVRTVSVVKLSSGFFAVGKDENGKVRKPSSFEPLSLKEILASAA